MSAALRPSCGRFLFSSSTLSCATVILEKSASVSCCCCCSVSVVVGAGAGAAFSASASANSAGWCCSSAAGTIAPPSSCCWASASASAMGSSSVAAAAGASPCCCCCCCCCCCFSALFLLPLSMVSLINATHFCTFSGMPTIRMDCVSLSAWTLQLDTLRMRVMLTPLRPKTKPIFPGASIVSMISPSFGS